MLEKLKLRTTTIIVLNGHSSSAKSSIVDKIQKALDEPMISIGVDPFFLSLGQKYFGEKKEEGINFYSYYKEEANTTEKLRTIIEYGKVAIQVFKGMPILAKYYYNNKLSVIIDDVIYYSELFQNYLEVLKQTRVFFIKVFCEENTLIERERFRFNRPLGLGIATYELIQKNMEFSYDFLIDTTNNDIDQQAKKIIEFVNNNEPLMLKNS